MSDINNKIIKIEKSDLLSVANEKKNEQWRLAQICCAYIKADNTYEVSYSFADGYELEHYRLVVDRDEHVPSISRIYNSAHFYENEMDELFDLEIDFMKNDTEDTLYRINATAPFVPADAPEAHHTPAVAVESALADYKKTEAAEMEASEEKENAVNNEKEGE